MIPPARDYQLEQIDALRAARGRGARIIVVQSWMGTGKTVLAGHIIKSAIAKSFSTLVLVHRRNLVTQFSDALIDFEIDHDVFMRGERFGQGTLCTVASRDTIVSRCMNNNWVGLPKAQLLIVDEGHHCWNPHGEYRQILDRYPNATILLLSATPASPEGQGLGPWAHAIVPSRPASWMIARRWLVPLKFRIPDRKRGKRGKQIMKGLHGEPVDSWKMFAEDRPTLFFTSRVAESKRRVDEFNAEGIPFVHIDAETTDTQREEYFAMLKDGRIKGISNVGIIGEGTNIPEVGCVQLFCGCDGRLPFYQRVGRAMRPHAGKEFGICIDHAGACYSHGFPDEDMEWALNGNTEELFAKKQRAGQTDKGYYCNHCKLAYHGSEFCPTCGRPPKKPPRSIFDPPKVRTSAELLIEPDRDDVNSEKEGEAKVKHWLKCLAVAANRGCGGGTFGMAAVIYKRKYNEFPADDFPYMPERRTGAWKVKILESHPGFKRERKVYG